MRPHRGPAHNPAVTSFRPLPNIVVIQVEDRYLVVNVVTQEAFFISDVHQFLAVISSPAP